MSPILVVQDNQRRIGGAAPLGCPTKFYSGEYHISRLMAFAATTVIIHVDAFLGFTDFKASFVEMSDRVV